MSTKYRVMMLQANDKTNTPLWWRNYTFGPTLCWTDNQASALSLYLDLAGALAMLRAASREAYANDIVYLLAEGKETPIAHQNGIKAAAA